MSKVFDTNRWKTYLFRGGASWLVSIAIMAIAGFFGLTVAILSPGGLFSSGLVTLVFFVVYLVLHGWSLEPIVKHVK